jgi:hypothetical protein
MKWVKKVASKFDLTEIAIHNCAVINEVLLSIPDRIGRYFCSFPHRGSHGLLQGELCCTSRSARLKIICTKVQTKLKGIKRRKKSKVLFLILIFINVMRMPTPRILCQLSLSDIVLNTSTIKC